jgi:hypothetical protein
VGGDDPRLARLAPFAVLGFRPCLAFGAAFAQINLGLDLAGGSHILLEADPSQVRQQRLDAMDRSVRNKLRQADASIRISDISNRDGSLTFLVNDASKVDAVREAILPLTSGAGLTGQRDWNIEVVDGNRFVLTPTQEGIDQAVSQAMDTAVEVVRKRIDGWAPRSRPSCVRAPPASSCRCPAFRTRRRSRRCSARPPSSNSRWSTTRPCRLTLPVALRRWAARSCPMPKRQRARRSRSSVWAAFAAMN